MLGTVLKWYAIIVLMGMGAVAVAVFAVRAGLDFWTWVKGGWRGKKA